MKRANLLIGLIVLACLTAAIGLSQLQRTPQAGGGGTASTVTANQGTAGAAAWKVDGSAVTQPVSAGSLPLPSGAATSAKQPALGTAGTASSDVITVQGISGMTALKVDPSAVTETVQGTKTNNNAAPGAANVGTLPVLANAAPPSWAEGNQVAHSADLAGNLRVLAHPPNALGYYSVNGRTPTYSGLSAGAVLVSFRWGSSTALAVILKVAIAVATTAGSSSPGAVERELIIARSFTASDSGGSAITMTGNNAKRRTSMATSLVTDFRAGAGLTAGTRTLDANPIASILSWIPTATTGVDIGNQSVIGTTSGGAPGTVAAAIMIGGGPMVPLLDATNGQEYPIVLAQNEGFLIRIGKDAMPAGATQQTYFQITWAEVSAY